MTGLGAGGWNSRAEPIRFIGQIRYWDPEKSSGLSVAEVPGEHIPWGREPLTSESTSQVSVWEKPADESRGRDR